MSSEIDQDVDEDAALNTACAQQRIEKITIKNTQGDLKIGNTVQLTNCTVILNLPTQESKPPQTTDTTISTKAPNEYEGLRHQEISSEEGQAIWAVFMHALNSPCESKELVQKAISGIQQRLYQKVIDGSERLQYPGSVTPACEVPTFKIDQICSIQQNEDLVAAVENLLLNIQKVQNEGFRDLNPGCLNQLSQIFRTILGLEIGKRIEEEFIRELSEHINFTRDFAEKIGTCDVGFIPIVKRITARVIYSCRQGNNSTSIRTPLRLEQNPLGATLTVNYVSEERLYRPYINALVAERDSVLVGVELEGLPTEISADYMLREDNAARDLETGRSILFIPEHRLRLLLKVHRNGWPAASHVNIKRKPTVCLIREKNPEEPTPYEDIVVGDTKAKLSNIFWDTMNDWIHERLREAVVQVLTELNRS